MGKLVYMSDYDNTICFTLISSPGSIGVIEAYEQAIAAVFGSEGLALYHQQGGLKMRAPGETVTLLLTAKPRLDDSARRWYEQGGWRLFDSLVPAGLGAPIDWENEPAKAATECLVVCKLHTLVGQIGRRNADEPVWPPLCPGFAEFWPWLYDWSIASGIELIDCVVSSGHCAFIEKAFAVHGLRLPRLLVTNDHTRAERGDQSRLNKPHPELLGLVNRVWVSQGNGNTPLSARHIMFAGDDVPTDMGFAMAIGAVPVHFKPDAKFACHNGRLTVPDWRMLSPWLETRTAQLQDSIPITELLGS